MCTLTLLPLGNGRVRFAFNRDAARSRPAAILPQRRRYGERTAILPIDPVSKGTWIGVNDAGLVLALLNVTPRGIRGHEPAIHSRGTIIPSLLTCATITEALGQLVDLPAKEYARFRLVLFAAGEVAEVVSDGERLWRKRPAVLSAPLLWTSSGLGDHLVERLRRQLFVRYVDRPGNWVTQQDAFHCHHWPDEPHLSVCMRRANACTVSYTVVELDASAAHMTYFPGSPDQPGRAAKASLLFEQESIR